MTDAPSRAIRLYGSDETPDAPRELRAGPLSAELEAGNLRYIRFHGAEVLRAVSFIVRDKDWGTYNPSIEALNISEGPDHFAVTFAAAAADSDQSFTYNARIEGHADGRLVFTCQGASKFGFLTNRTGFVILHPIEGIAGKPVDITHTNGTTVAGTFPAIIDPIQPMMDLRSLSHTTPQGLRVTCLMEGDTYEMEDQRNWTDASYKTYVRPLARPWPYRLEPGEAVDQTITVTVTGEIESGVSENNVSVGLRQGTGSVPALGEGLDPDDATAALDHADPLSAMGMAHLICHHDVRRGHDRPTLQHQLEVARMMGAEPWLEAVIASVEGAAAEIAALGTLAAGLGAPFKTVLISPAADLKCTLPGSPWPPAPDARAIYQATRAAFPNARIGGGMFSYFTELNRKRPPTDALDLISFTTSPMVHAGDDHSVMETLEAMPAIVASVERIANGVPYAVGPSAIGVRDNPYGEEAKDNPGNIRQAMNWNDPRQRGLLGAAWALGYFASFATGGATAVALGAPVGAFGAVSTPARFAQPWYDENGGLYPIYHVLRGLAHLRALPLCQLVVSRSGRIRGLAAQTSDATEMWLANPNPEPVNFTLKDFSEDRVFESARLDAENFVAASQDIEFLDRLSPLPGSTVTLDAYAIIRVINRATNRSGR